MAILGAFTFENNIYHFLSFYMGQSVQIVALPYHCAMRVGRRDSNDIIIRHPYVSGEHMIIRGF